MSKGVFSRTLFVFFYPIFFSGFFVLAIFPPLPSKLTLEIIKRRFFSNPFRFFFFFSFSFSFVLVFLSICFRFGYFSSFAFN